MLHSYEILVTQCESVNLFICLSTHLSFCLSIFQIPFPFMGTLLKGVAMPKISPGFPVYHSLSAHSVRHYHFLSSHIFIHSVDPSHWRFSPETFYPNPASMLSLNRIILILPSHIQTISEFHTLYVQPLHSPPLWLSWPY